MLTDDHVPTCPGGQTAGPLPPHRRRLLRQGLVIPAHPLALNADRHWDERRQRALSRYYLDAGAGGLAVAVHTTQFALHDPALGLLRPVLQAAIDEIDRHPAGSDIVRVVGVTGSTAQAVAEAEQARELGYDIALVSPGGLPDLTPAQLLDRSAAIGEVLPVFGFYLQEAVGGRHLPREYWRALADQPSTVGVKAAPFDRYRTLDLVRGVAESDRAEEVSLYTGNDDNIVADLLTPYDIPLPTGTVRRRFVGGLLGHWAVWTRSAVRLLTLAHRAVAGDPEAAAQAWSLSAGVTEANAAVFDVAGGFEGVIAGVHEVLRRQGLLAGTWCLDPAETLSPGQAELLGDVLSRYEWARQEQSFIADRLEDWLA